MIIWDGEKSAPFKNETTRLPFFCLLFFFYVLNLTLYTSIKLNLKHMNSDFNTDKNTNVNTKTESLRQNEILN